MFRKLATAAALAFALFLPLDLATQLVSHGHKLTLFKEDELDLEGAFMALTKGITA